MNTEMSFCPREGASAEEIRAFRIDEYSAKLKLPCCLGRDARYNLLAYQIMTDEQILLSEKRESDGEDILDFRRRVREHSERSSRVNHLVG